MMIQTAQLDSQMRRAFRQTVGARRNERGALILFLQDAQEKFGYIPREIISDISEETGMSEAEIFGVVTFYSQFRMTPLGKYVIRICEGTACHVNGAKKVLQTLKTELGIDVNETSEDGLFSLQSVACLGCCSLAPVIMVNGETHGSLTPDKTKKVIDNCRSRG
jgi:NADH-quinone oxidoreductase subunit E